ncbi:unnamed protein product [Timema podura]|uniref:Uncharacterized protein n=1 Tax=Timema podura TaxID=61482 RepID=A0ABN7P7G5_TIMPD|nr:unnamed protein product [Timema podura]
MTPSIRKERFKRSHEELHPIVDAEILVNDIGNIHEPKYFLSGVDNNFGFSSSIAKNDKEYIKKHMGPRLKSDEHEEEEYKEPLFLARNEPLKIERKESVASILGNIAKYKCSRLIIKLDCLEPNNGGKVCQFETFSLGFDTGY